MKLLDCLPFCVLMALSAMWVFFLISACGAWGL
jgi:hypothetical protein